MEKTKRVASTPERLERAMADANMKQIDLSRTTGLSHSTISRYLSGAVEPRQTATHKLAIALDVNELWLWGYDVPKERPAHQTKKPTASDDELSESQKALMKFVESIPEEKADFVLRVMKSILEDN